jgi:hypothetical protein
MLQRDRMPASDADAHAAAAAVAGVDVDDPLVVLIDQLHGGDARAAADAADSLVTFAVALGPARVRSDLVHFLAGA